MAVESLEEAQKKYRAADAELVAAKKAFDEAPWANQEVRVQTWERLKKALEIYNEAVKEYSDFVTGRRR